MKHGKCESSEYNSWAGMKARCYNAKHKGYQHWGGRGIFICAYLKNFVNFYKLLGDKPEGHRISIDRIIDDDPDPRKMSYTCGSCQECLSNHSPMNVRWATPKEQCNNKRNNHLLTYNGKTQNIAKWTEELGFSRGTLSSRIFDYNYSIEKALTTPVYKPKYIYQDKKYWIIDIKKVFKKRINKSFKTKEEAESYRDQVLKDMQIDI